ncbi:GNAT family N-acetyltransferase [Microbacterium soli]|uniref:GNAT family N-acetyltransferase n=1 Tax=Microbacterium soli TaxID=446075 RepID=A0ABP7MNX7_9MICO
MSAAEDRTVPVDPESFRRLAERGLTYRLIDTSSDADVEGFLRADARGFLEPDPSVEAVAQRREMIRERRSIGVFDDAADGWPIGTVSSWVAPLTVPGGEVPLWAISAVTVAGTHRRRGIARALLEGELRTAASGGVPVAGLTVSEATIYGRYGFGSAVPVARFTVDTRRAGWAGPTPRARVVYADRRTVADDLSALQEQSRPVRSGQIPGWPQRWVQLAGLQDGDGDGAAVRGVRCIDADGTVCGAMTYTLVEVPGTFRFEMRIRVLVSTTDDALRALWRFVVQHDLVDRAVVDLRPVDDPLPWLVVDQRAVTVEVHDHGWLRILDVRAALQARRFRAPLDAVLRVRDPLGFAEGTWRVQVGDDGRATVTATDAEPQAVLAVSALSAVYAGGESLSRLAAAGLIDGDEVTIAALGHAFSTDPAPLLGIWY